MGASSTNSDYPGGPEAGKEDQIVLLKTATVKKAKHLAPQDAIDEFWAKFNTKTPGKASTILPKDVHAKKVGERAPKGVVQGQNAVASYEEAAKICKEKVAKIVKECRRVNQKYRDPHFDIEFDLKWGVNDCLSMLTGANGADNSWFSPGSVKRVGDIFDDPKFYVKGATANDIRQGRDGDCWFMSALCTLGNKDGLIEKVCVARDEHIGVYGFVFHRDGEWRSEVIDDKLYLTKPDYDESWIERNLIEDRQRINSEEDYRKIYQSNSGALYFAQCEDPNETWLPLMEKAYAKAHGDYASIEGGFTGEGLEDLTGGVTTELFSTDILDKEYFWKEELLKVNEEFLFGCASGIFWGRGYRKGIYEGHAYSIMRAVEIDGQRLCLLRNPWGEGEWTGPWSDGSKEWTPEWMTKLDHRFGDDGAFWMSYDDLLKKFQTFDRTRLFTDDWKVTQQWTSLTVPWTVDYHDTKFSFTLEKKAPVVIVLSQLDERYFRGLEGEYKFELSFRVHKAGQEDYIIRSHGNYWMRRSVTAELELDEGEYNVLMKIEAVREEHGSAVEDILRQNAKDRRDKLLRIGLAYDLAHAKGHFQETEEDKIAKKAKVTKKLDKEKKALKEKLLKQKKRRKYIENKERAKGRAARDKRIAKQKAKVAKKAEKEKADKEKSDQEKAEKDTMEKPIPTSDLDAKVDSEATPQIEEVVSGVVSGEEVKSGEPAQDSVDKSVTITLSPAKEPDTVSATPATDSSKASPTSEAQKPAPANLAAVEIRLDSSSVPPSMAGFPDDSDDDSDLDSIVSDISSGVIEEALEEQKIAEKDAAVDLPKSDDEEDDEFQKDPWNAIAVIGLRVYSKGSCITVKVVKPPVTDDEEVTKAEGKLDVDDSARDATKNENNKEGDAAVVEVVIRNKDSDEAKKVEGSQKGEDGSEGSVVIV